MFVEQTLYEAYFKRLYLITYVSSALTCNSSHSKKNSDQLKIFFFYVHFQISWANTAAENKGL